MEKLVLIDGNSLLNRAFYATPAFTTKNGTPTNGVFGFVKLLLKIISEKKPTHLAVAFDLRAPTFRHKMYADYKAGRKPMPEDLATQFPILKEVLSAMQIKICEVEGYEADDIIGTLAKRFDIPTFIYTGDRDAYQLVDNTTNVCFTKKGVSDILELNAENFKTEIGIAPRQIIDLKALMGDKSDNIPGVAGVGEKSAMSLIQTYGDLDLIYAHIDEIQGALNKKLVAGKESAYFSRELATIEVNAGVCVTLENCRLVYPFPYLVREKFAGLDFKSLLDKNIYAEKLETGMESFPKVETDEKNEIEDDSNSIETFETVILTDINDGVSAIGAAFSEAIACSFSEEEFRFYLPNEKKEYVCLIKKELLDVGFYDFQLQPIFKRIFKGNKRVVSFNVKDIMHRLQEMDIEHSAKYDDVAILKCLAEGLGNTDTLKDCIEIHLLPKENTAYAIWYLYKKYLSEMSERERDLYYQVELPLIEVLFDMEKQGVSINQSILEELSSRYCRELNALAEKIYDIAGERFNINSPKQLGVVLFEKMKIGQGKKKNKESKSYKTTAEELEKYAEESEIVRYLLRYRKIQKLNSTYIEGFKPLIYNGKVHTTYNQSNTQTGRLSSMNPNIQNIPVRTEEGRELRKLFCASSGCVLIDADYSQIELRLLAHFSACKELVAAYCEGRDIHTATAALVFGVSEKDVTSAMRREAKAVNFGIIYGISAFGLSNDLNISPKKAQEYIDRYFEEYSDVKEYMQKNVEMAKKYGYVTTLLGRRRVINELRASNFNVRSFGERAAMNMPLQGSSADIIKKAMINVYKRLKEGGYKAKLILQVHDELIIDAPKSEAEAVSVILKEEMENAVALKIPLTVDVGVGNTWFDTK